MRMNVTLIASAVFLALTFGISRAADTNAPSTTGAAVGTAGSENKGNPIPVPDQATGGTVDIDPKRNPGAFDRSSANSFVAMIEDFRLVSVSPHLQPFEPSPRDALCLSFGAHDESNDVMQSQFPGAAKAKRPGTQITQRRLGAFPVPAICRLSPEELLAHGERFQSAAAAISGS
jgi:hypothetical protein